MQNGRCPRIGKTRLESCAKREKLIGIRSADFIRASDTQMSHTKAGHMTAPDQFAETLIKTLACGSHPHMTLRIEERG